MFHATCSKKLPTIHDATLLHIRQLYATKLHCVWHALMSVEACCYVLRCRQIDCDWLWHFGHVCCIQTILYAADEGLLDGNIVQSVVNWYCYIIAHNQFAYMYKGIVQWSLVVWSSLYINETWGTWTGVRWVLKWHMLMASGVRQCVILELDNKQPCRSDCPLPLIMLVLATKLG